GTQVVNERRKVAVGGMVRSEPQWTGVVPAPGGYDPTGLDPGCRVPARSGDREHGQETVAHDRHPLIVAEEVAAVLVGRLRGQFHVERVRGESHLAPPVGRVRQPTG